MAKNGMSAPLGGSSTAKDWLRCSRSAASLRNISVETRATMSGEFLGIPTVDGREFGAYQ
jgi:hypothetical protein